MDDVPLLGMAVEPFPNERTARNDQCTRLSGPLERSLRERFGYALSAHVAGDEGVLDVDHAPFRARVCQLGFLVAEHRYEPFLLLAMLDRH